MAIDEDAVNEGRTWLIDSGYSNHMIGEKDLFKSIEPTTNKTIRLGDGKALQVEGVGSISFGSSSGNPITLSKIQLMPNLTHNLLSVR